MVYLIYNDSGEIIRSSEEITVLTESQLEEMDLEDLQMMYLWVVDVDVPAWDFDNVDYADYRDTLLAAINSKMYENE